MLLPSKEHYASWPLRAGLYLKHGQIDGHIVGNPTGLRGRSRKSRTPSVTTATRLEPPSWLSICSCLDSWWKQLYTGYRRSRSWSWSWSHVKCFVVCNLFTQKDAPAPVPRTPPARVLISTHFISSSCCVYVFQEHPPNKEQGAHKIHTHPTRWSGSELHAESRTWTWMWMVMARRRFMTNPLCMHSRHCHELSRKEDAGWRMKDNSTRTRATDAVNKQMCLIYE